MPAANLPTAPANEKSEPEVHKDPLKIRVALFFDGTLNNRVNIGEREKNELGIENKQPEKYKDSSSDSYNNGRTNIAIMEPHVETNVDGYDYFFKHYIEGQGTFNLKEDSTSGYALGMGDSGVPGRAEQGIRKAVNTIIDTIDYSKKYVAKLTVDVFGFSRGAATARYAIYLILYGLNGGKDARGHAYYGYQPMAGRLREWSVQIEDSAVEIHFAGLYDTVLSYIASQYVKWTTNTLKQGSVVNAKKVLHLAAADEHRKDFPLHRIVSAVKKGVGEEYFLPGVHADVGGSYNMANQIQIRDVIQKEGQVANPMGTRQDKGEGTEITKTVYKNMGMRPNKEGDKNGPIELNWYGASANDVKVINKTGKLEDIEQDRKDLIAQGWYHEDEIKVHTIQPEPRALPTYVLTVWRDNINSAYNNIPLKIMAKRAGEQGIKISGDLKDIADAILAPFPVLKKLEGTINDYINSHRNTSKPGDWIDDHGEKNTAELKKIRHGYLDFSSYWDIGYYPHIVWDKKDKKYIRRRYYYNA